MYEQEKDKKVEVNRIDVEILDETSLGLHTTMGRHSNSKVEEPERTVDIQFDGRFRLIG